MRKLLKNIFISTFPLICAGYAVAQDSVDSIMFLKAPISSNDIEFVSSLSLELSYQEPRIPLSQYLQSNTEGSDVVLKNVINSIGTSNFEEFVNNSSGSEDDMQQLFEQLSFINRQNAFNSEAASIIYKIYYGNDILYLIKTFFLNSDRVFGLQFSLVDGNYKYLATLPTPPLKDLIDTTIASAEILGQEYISEEINQEYKSRTLVDGQYPIEIHYPDHWLTNYSLLSQEPSQYAGNSETASNVLSFYEEIFGLLEQNQVQSVFGMMDDASVNRLTGGDNNFPVEEMAEYLSNILIPQFIVLVVDLDPFLLVVGTNNINEFQEILSTNDDREKIDKLLNHSFIFEFLIKNNDSVQLTHIRTQSFVDRFIGTELFRRNVIVQALVDNE